MSPILPCLLTLILMVNAIPTNAAEAPPVTPQDAKAGKFKKLIEQAKAESRFTSCDSV